MASKRRDGKPLTAYQLQATEDLAGLGYRQRKGWLYYPADAVCMARHRHHQVDCFLIHPDRSEPLGRLEKEPEV